MDKKSIFKTFIGIDISKKTVDICILDSNGKVLIQEKTENNLIQIKKKAKEFMKKYIISETLICYENTGVYTMILNSILPSLGWNVWVVPAIEIKRSLGIKRGKNDKSDAKDIALYSLSNQYKFNPYSLPSEDIQKLKLLRTERDKLVDCVKQLKTTQENIDFYPKKMICSLMKINTKTIKALMDSISKIEIEIDEIVKANSKIKQQINLITSIPGVGLNTALYMVLVTNQFENFKEWRRMACYAGVAPFEYSSGTSIRGRNKVNHLADKKLKSLLYMCALSSIKNNKEIKAYFDKKKSEGKHSMLIVNNIKCKILARIFAVINREQPFVETNKWAA